MHHAGDCLHQFWTLSSLHCLGWHYCASLFPSCNWVVANVATLCVPKLSFEVHRPCWYIPSTNDSLDIWRNIFITMLIIAGVSLALMYSATLQCIWLLQSFEHNLLSNQIHNLWFFRSWRWLTDTWSVKEQVQNDFKVSEEVNMPVNVWFMCRKFIFLYKNICCALCEDQQPKLQVVYLFLFTTSLRSSNTKGQLFPVLSYLMFSIILSMSSLSLDVMLFSSGKPSAAGWLSYIASSFLEFWRSLHFTAVLLPRQ